MPSAAYIAAAAAFSKQVQWLIEIDLDRCDNDYTSAGGSACTAADAGDGSRCYFTYPTCQDPANYVKTTRTLRFCLNDVPWPDTSIPVYPLLKELVSVPQKINPKKLATWPETITLNFYRDDLPPVPDSDKTTGAGLYNTAPVGEFWRNLFARSRNYSGRSVRILRGFNTSGFVLADFEKVGPTYLMSGVKFEQGMVTIKAESPLRDLEKRQLPFEVSDDNVLQTSAPAIATTWSVLDASEFPNPSDYTRNLNKVYAECDSEIVQITGRDTTLNTLTVVRAAFGTNAVLHQPDAKVKHVACFGAANGDPMNSMEALQDLLEWAGVAAGDVNTSEFDSVKGLFFPDEDVTRIVRRQKSIAKLVQQLREIRSVVLFINTAGKWTPAVMGPNLTSATLDDDSLLVDSVDVDEDDDERVTRVVLWYDPEEDNAKDPEDFAKGVAVINAGLEDPNFFNDVRSDTHMDLWTDGGFTLAKIRNLARRIITRAGYGLRYVTFSLDVKDGTLNVGDMRTIQTRECTGIDGEQIAMPVLITAKKEIDRSRIRYEGIDTNYSGRFARIGPDTMADDYDSATEEDKQYGYWGTATYNRVGSLLEEGYIKF